MGFAEIQTRDLSSAIPREVASSVAATQGHFLDFACCVGIRCSCQNFSHQDSKWPQAKKFFRFLKKQGVPRSRLQLKEWAKEMRRKQQVKAACKDEGARVRTRRAIVVEKD